MTERSEWRQRFENACSELRESGAFKVVRDRIDLAVVPVDEDYEAGLREECEDFALDDAMRAIWSELDQVDFEWRANEVTGGRLLVPNLERLAQTAFLEDEVALWDPDERWDGRNGGPIYAARDEQERRFLLELHHLECFDANYWTALRVRAGHPAELWIRRDVGSGAIDLRLDADVGTYFETMLRARGVGGWPLLLVSCDAIDESSRAGVARIADQLERSLEVLAVVPAARPDAEALIAQLADVRADVSRS